MKFALAGNPNSGKTTLFNSLTGSTAHTGNWPGVTVDKREGVYKKLKEKVTIVDLPGIYSLSPYTPEEVVSRNFILDEKPDCIINIVDATNLERNLYLTTQLLEIDVPIVIALNMMDAVTNSGRKININDLEKTLGVKVIPISALKHDNIKDLMEIAYEEAKKERNGFSVLKGSQIDEVIQDTTLKMAKQGIKSPLFHAIKLIENDEIEINSHPEIKQGVDDLKNKVPSDEFGVDYEAVVADLRYKYITKHFQKTVSKSNKDDIDGVTKSDKIDKVLTNRWAGIPIFLFIMFLIFHFVFSEDLLFLNAIFGLEIDNEVVINILTGMSYEGEALAGIPSIGVFLQSWMGFLTGSLINGVSYLFELGGVGDTWYAGLICDGILNGLDSIFSFLPQIMLLFLFISILEDSGYMARVAFILDRAFRKFGLSGKAFIPFLMGFGCSVPAMMAAKTLEDQRERDLTIRLTPFFSCGAKAPIWAMLAFCFAGTLLGDVFVFSIYLLGIVIAIIASILTKVFSKNVEVPPFIMELPAYHLPQFSNVVAHLWEKLKHFIYKAATIITAAIILIWFLSNFGWMFWNGLVDIEESMLADIGRLLRYFFYPLVWAQNIDYGWKLSVASITGLIAKENVVATMAVLFEVEESEEAIANAILLSGITLPEVYSFAAYNLFTFPCFAAIGAAYGESSKKGFVITLLFWFFGSYIISLLIYWLLNAFTFAWWLGLIIALSLIGLIILAALIVSKKTKTNLKTA